MVDSRPIPLRTQSPPVHVAIIMDGNGRWAKARSLPRAAGHKRGAEAVRVVIRAAADLGVRYLTLFGFSSENWGRPAGEVNDLMGLLRLYLRNEVSELHKNGVRLCIIGDRGRLPSDIVSLVEEAESLTEANVKLTVTVALSYGGRQEIIRAAQLLVEAAMAGRIRPEDIDERAMVERLFTVGMPDPDLLIRTSGEKRLSNFLLWQSAYAELVFTETLWPDFNRDDLESALGEYYRRERRYGAVHI